MSSPIETGAKFHVSSLPHGKQDSCTNLRHTRATATALLYRFSVQMDASPLGLHYCYAS